jgi:hypothetical protein
VCFLAVVVVVLGVSQAEFEPGGVSVEVVEELGAQTAVDKAASGAGQGVL